MTYLAQLRTGRLRTSDLYRKVRYSVAHKVADGLFFGDIPTQAIAPVITQRLRAGRPGIIEPRSTLPKFSLAKAFCRIQPSYRLRSTHFATDPHMRKFASKLFFGEFVVDSALGVDAAEAIAYPLILREEITNFLVTVYDPPDGAKIIEPPFGVLESTLAFTRPKPFLTAGGGGGGGGQVSYGG